MARRVVILHERRGYWNRHLRPRLAHRAVRWVETRSTADLDNALKLAARPLVLIDLGHRLRDGLVDLIRVAERAPLASILVMERLDRPGVAALARELGATHVMSGTVPPPTVASLLERWISLSCKQSQHDGWSPQPYPEAHSWEAWLAEL